MDDRTLDEVHRFTTSVDSADLYAYLSIEQDADKVAITHALQVRRSWAQGQQANPKYRTEALWLIKNINLVKATLTTHAQVYLKDIEARDEQAKLETLSVFIKGTLAGGELTARGEEAIAMEGELLELPESVVVRRIGEILAELDAAAIATPESTEPAPTAPVDLAGVTDLYQILDTDPDSDQAELEAAYRRRYRWARQLRDTEQSSRIYAQIDEAWRVLKDPDRRAAYDAEQMGSPQAAPDSVDTASQFLPPPPPTAGISLPMPSVEQHLARISAQDSQTDPEATHAPAIAMPAPVGEREAPPPPSVPPPGSIEAEPDPDDNDSQGSDTNQGLEALEMMSLENVLEQPSEDAPETPPALIDLDGPTTEADPVLAEFDEAGSTEWLEELTPPPPDPFPDEMDMMSFRDVFAKEEDAGPEMALSELDAQTEEPEVSIEDGLNLNDADPTDGLLLERPAPPSGQLLDAGQLFNELAILRVDGPKVIRIRTGSNPFPVRITVRNEGEGAMAGSVSTNVPWIQISPTVLNPMRPHQIIEALVEPDGIPGNAGKAIITIDTSHGETRSVTIDALKHVVSPVMMFVAALSLVGIVGLFAGLYLSGIIGSGLKTPDRTILAINVDPPAGEVYIDDALVGNQGTLSLVDTFPIGKPFQIRVELDGFQPYTRDITVGRGTQFRVEADLILRDTMSYSPPPDAAEATIEPSVIDNLIGQKQDHFNACFTRNLRTNEPFAAEIMIHGIVTARGYIQGLRFGEANFRSPAVETCLKRQLRAIQLPLIAGDFGRFDQLMGAEIRPSTALNDETDQ